MSVSGRAAGAMRQADAEGLTLLRAESNSTGYKGVSWHTRPEAKPYRAEVRRGGKKVHLGDFTTAEEAALAYARTPEAQAAVAAAAAPPAPPPMTAEEALRRVEAEGLTLLKSDSSSTGYKGVSNSSSKTRPFQAKVRRGGTNVHLGYCATAEEAALCYARSPEAQVALAAAAALPPTPPPMTAEEALRQAEAEGLTLLRSESSSTGFKGVSFKSGKANRLKPYKAQVKRGGKTVSLGDFMTAEEAALAYARTPEAQAAVAAAAAPPEPPLMTAEEALRQAAAEGLTLLRSEGSSTGYKGVSNSSSSTGFKGVSFKSGKANRLKPYKAQVKRGGKTVSLGDFMTAEEAALAYARTPEAQAAVAAAAAPPAPPPMTAEEALRQAEAEGLTLLKSDGSTGYKGVSFKSGRAKGYKAKLWRGGKDVTLGSFATAEEAALVFARDAAAAAPQPPAASSRKRKVKSEEQPPDMPAGARVKLEEQPPPMPNDAVVKLEYES